MARRPGGRGLEWLAAAVGFAAGAYAVYVASTWSRYGRPARPLHDDQDPLLDKYMPVYDVVTRHRCDIDAAADVTLAAARDMALLDSPIARALFKWRELIFGATHDREPRPSGLLAQVQALGWVLLEESPGREIVVGAVTKPWEPDVTFRGVPADQFAAFAEPDYVKIVWNLRADPVTESQCVFRTETRALATDAAAGAKFRAYWSLLSPGMMLIRWAALGPLAREAAHRDAARRA